MSLNQAKTISLERAATPEEAPAIIRQLEQALKQEPFKGRLHAMRSDRNSSVSVTSEGDIYTGGVKYSNGKFVANIPVKAEGEQVVYDGLQRVLKQYEFA